MEFCRSDGELIPDLEHRINSIRQNIYAFQNIGPEILHKHGICLWNKCVQLKREADDGTSRLECLLRVFAFMLLDHHQKAAKCSPDQNTRLLRIVNRLACCLLQNDLFLGPAELCGWVFERAADYEHALNQAADYVEQDELLARRKLRCEHRLQRITLARLL